VDGVWYHQQHPEVLNPVLAVEQKPRSKKTRTKQAPVPAVKQKPRSKKTRTKQAPVYSSSASSVSWDENESSEGEKHNVVKKKQPIYKQSLSLTIYLASKRTDVEKQPKTASNCTTPKASSSSSSSSSSDDDDNGVGVDAVDPEEPALSDAEHTLVESTDTAFLAILAGMKGIEQQRPVLSRSSNGMAENSDDTNNGPFFLEMRATNDEMEDALRKFDQEASVEAKENARVASEWKKDCYERMYKFKETLKTEAKEKLEGQNSSMKKKRRQLVLAHEKMQDEVRKKHGGKSVVHGSVSEHRAHGISVRDNISSVPDIPSISDDSVMPILSIPNSPHSSAGADAEKLPLPLSTLQMTTAELLLRVQEMQKEGGNAGAASAAMIGGKASGICTKEHAMQVAHHLAALCGKKRAPEETSKPPGECKLTRFGNPKRKPKLTTDEKAEICAARRLKSDKKYDAALAARKKRKARIARNKQAKVDRSNRHKVDKQNRQDAKDEVAAEANRAAEAKRAAEAPD